MKRRSKFLIVLALVTAGVLAAAVALFVYVPAPAVTGSGAALVGRSTTSGTALIGGPFLLVATDGKNVTDQTYRGKWLLIYFGYTFCPDACPTALNNISVALEKLGPDAGKFQPLFVTVDPQRDTRDVMADYLKSFDSRIVGLTGNQAQIDNVVKQYRIYVEQQKSEAGEDNYLVSHSAYIYLMDPQGKFANVIEGIATGEEIAAWLRKQMTHSKR